MHQSKVIPFENSDKMTFLYCKKTDRNIVIPNEEQREEPQRVKV